MRILVCAGHFYPYIGGYEKYILELYKRLVNKYDIDILTYDNQNNPQYEKVFGLNVYRLSSWDLLGNTYPIPKPNIKNLKLLFKIYKKKYNFINTQTWFFSINLIGYLFSKFKKIKLIHTEHGTSHVILNNKLFSLLNEIYDHTLGSLIIKSAWKNVGISKASCEFSKHLGAKSTYLVPNGIDISIFKKKKTNLKIKLKISKEYKIITFIGRLIYAKGVQDLISVFPKIKEKYPKIKLLIIGDGNYKMELEKISNDKDIIFLGQRKDIIDILNITDIFINPSYSEGLPTSVLEAGAIGLPVIATDVGGTKEIITNQKTGLLIKKKNLKEIKETIIFMLDHPQKMDDYKDNLNKLIKNKFDWEIIFKKWKNILIK